MHKFDLTPQQCQEAHDVLWNFFESIGFNELPEEDATVFHLAARLMREGHKLFEDAKKRRDTSNLQDALLRQAAEQNHLQ